jgi:predicted ATP-grasp superfamily ATP-dependent carboligase
VAILHADRGALTLGATQWPNWSADRGPPGTFIPENAPLASVFAEAATADEAQRLALARLAELEDLIYEHTQS